jgi:membrane peptidoglycan carboxypeptidase
VARRMTQPNARYITPATTGEIFGQVRRGQAPGRGAAQGNAQGNGGAAGPDGYATGPAGPGARRPAGPPRRPGRRFIDYPRFGRSGWRRWVPSWKLVGAICTLGFATLVAAFLTAYASTTVPDASKLVKQQTTVVYYADGHRELGRLAEQNRRLVQLGQVPPHVQNAVLAAEDRSFWKNSGVNPTSILRAAYANARGKPLQGGSTITQQYVKNYFDLRERTVSRKAKEFFIALKINRTKSKPEILEDYLNTIYFGKGAYGVEAASETYFGKPVSKLDVSEAAFLAGIINSPNNYDPADGAASVQRAQRRWNYVLDGMVTEGWLTPADRAQQKWPEFVPQKKPATLGGQNGYLMRMAQAEAAKDLEISEDEVETGGYKIVTTFNQRMESEAADAVKEVLPKKVPAGLEIAIVTLDPRDGRVLMVYGGKDYLARQQNAATQDRAQAGSTFKPFGLIAALTDHVALKSRFSGRSPMEIDGTKVKNFGGEDFGQIDLLKATASSVNTVYVQLNKQVGPERTKAVALAAGLPDDKDTNVQGNLVNVLGSASPHPIDMATAYGTIANQGEKVPRSSITAIYDSEGERVCCDKAPPKHVFDKDVMADVTYAMRGVVERGSGGAARALGRQVAGKTGTSSDSRSAWFIGFTPDRVTAVAMYQNDKNGNPVAMEGFGGHSSITGGGYPADIWTEYMKAALGNSPELEFPDPEWVGNVQNPAPEKTRNDGGGDQQNQPTTSPDPTGPPNPTATSDPSETKPTRTKRPRPTFSLPTIGPTNGNGNGNGGG